MSRLPVSSPEERDEALGMLGRIARTHLTGNVSAEVGAEAARRFRTELARTSEADVTRRNAKRWAAAMAVAAILATLFVTRSFWRRPALTFDVDMSIVAERDYFFVPSTAPSGHVAFSDGSRLTLSPGGRGRVVALHAEGAEIGLEDGRASLEVVHRPGTRWSVAAGPFAILVTGTAFDVRWSGADEMFEVDLRAGSVTIRGPLAAAGIELRAGQRLVADLRASQLRIERLGAEARDATPSNAEKSGELAAASASARASGRAAADGVAALLAAPSDREASRARAQKREASDDAKSGWTQRVAAGDFRGVLTDAEQRGMDVTLARSSLTDLVALADAARYAGRVDVAERALRAQRERFAGSNPARTAAFLLGRLADTSEGKPASAIGWYDRYLAETPGGEFASEALGRKLVAVQRVSGAAAARPVAEEYLRRFPQGPYASKAREFTLAP